MSDRPPPSQQQPERPPPPPSDATVIAPVTQASAPSSPEPAPVDMSAAQKRKLALLEKIAEFERRGAILYADAHTLRNQVHDSTSGQWRAVETRLKQLAMSWNPYQDFSAEDRKVQEKNEKARLQHLQKQKVGKAKYDGGVESDGGVEQAMPSPSLKEASALKKKQDFYELLQIEDRDNVTSGVIRRQFRKLALLLHPDKQQQQAQAQVAAAVADASNEEEEKKDAVSNDSEEELPVVDNSIEFARLRLAYETLSDPEQRAAYDAKLNDVKLGKIGADDTIFVKNQIQLEASTDFASLEWMARVKHKMDVMDRIAEWATILGINATQIRFETGEPCTGRHCGKIVTMDRDLECYGSPRRRVYVCLLHKYIHACDELCTSRYGDAELDKKVCPMRAYWLIQNWLFDQLQHAATVKQEEEESKDDGFQSPPQSPMQDHCSLEASEIHLGDGSTSFSIANASMCRSGTCAMHFQYLDDGIYACQSHGTPHLCTYEQCDAKVLRNGRYVCWASGNLYGGYREEVGTGTRTRQILYTDSHGESAAIEMEVPVLLPLGKMTSYLLEGGGSRSKSGDVSSLSPPPPGDKAWHTPEKNPQAFPETDPDERSPRPMLKRRNSERETSPVRARIRRRLSEKVQQSEVSSFYIHLKLPAAVGSLPRVALELQDPGESEDMEGQGEHFDKLLPIRVRAKDTVNYIKFWMEELTDQQISIWDQQILWGDTIIGDEGNVMVLEEHGIVDGCVLELRLHDDCPLLVSTWNGRTAISGNGESATAEYNTVMISKEAEEELEDLHAEWENVIAVEEESFERSRLRRKREKLEDTGALNHTELIHYDGKAPRLVGVIPTSRNQTTGLLTQYVTQPGAFVPEVRGPSASTKQAKALQAISEEAKPLKK
ncbi:hypothetical protein Gpo141_00010497 [Globisporangium polare]